MRYEGDIYRPPSEAYSLLVQVTVGCSHNKCTFCDMFKAKSFHIRKMEDILEDLEWARRQYRYVGRAFLCDGDALCLSMDKLNTIFDRMNQLFPECQQINVYGNAKDVNRKSPEDLKVLRDKGLKIIYIGAESGSEKVLQDINKGSTREEIIRAVRKIEDCGIKASVTFISGLAGKEGWQEHAIETGKMISEMNPSYAALLTLFLRGPAPMVEQVRSGELTLLTPEEVLAETELLLENVNVEGPTVFRSNHASNYLNLAGNLPEDRETMLARLHEAMENLGMLKSEYFRAL